MAAIHGSKTTSGSMAGAGVGMAVTAAAPTSIRTVVIVVALVIVVAVAITDNRLLLCREVRRTQRPAHQQSSRAIHARWRALPAVSTVEPRRKCHSEDPATTARLRSSSFGEALHSGRPTTKSWRSRARRPPTANRFSPAGSSLNNQLQWFRPSAAGGRREAKR